MQTRTLLHDTLIIKSLAPSLWNSFLILCSKKTLFSCASDINLVASVIQTIIKKSLGHQNLHQKQSKLLPVYACNLHALLSRHLKLSEKLRKNQFHNDMFCSNYTNYRLRFCRILHKQIINTIKQSCDFKSKSASVLCSFTSMKFITSGAKYKIQSNDFRKCSTFPYVMLWTPQ